jgi:peptide/nickel transport system substrate-binding protein
MEKRKSYLREGIHFYLGELEMSILRVMLLTLLLLSLPFLSSVLAAPPAIQRQMEIVEATIEGGSIASVDPAAIYDTASAAILLQTHDTLICFDGEHMDRYLPSLATEWTIKENTPPIVSTHTGLTFYFTYYFKIRTGVPWQNSPFGSVTPEDVEYTFERGMVLEPGDNPQWMFYEPLLNGATMTYIDGHDVDPEGNLTERAWVGWAIDEAVESNSTHVWFNLAFNGAYAPFLQILTQQWSSIICKAWANNLDRPTNWNGTWGADHTAYYAYHFPAVPPLDDPTPAVMGSGPFKLAHLDQTLYYWDVDRFTGYWRGWPFDWPTFGNSRPGGYVDHYVVTWGYDWNARSTMFLNGDIDICAVPRYWISQVQGQPGIRCTSRLPSLRLDTMCFQFNINSSNPYFPIFTPGTFDESGIPSDFFGNPSWGIHVRKAFAWAFDYENYLSIYYLGEGTHPPTVVLPVLPHYDPSIQGYSINLSKVAEELHQVPGLWDTGFTFEFLSNVGANYRPIWIVGNQTSQAINSLNPKFHVTVAELDWSSYLAASMNKQLAVFPGGWLADYPDPYDFVYPNYYSQGTFGYKQGYNSSTMDTLCKLGISQSNYKERDATYAQIQQLAIDDCPSIPLGSPVGRHFERTWVCGWYYNPTYPVTYAANLWKWYYTPHAQQDSIPANSTGNLLPYDVNYDGKTNMVDIGTAAACFGAAYGPPINPRWAYRCDFNNDRKIDMKDIGGVAKNFGKTSLIWAPSP